MSGVWVGRVYLITRPGNPITQIFSSGCKRAGLNIQRDDCLQVLRNMLVLNSAVNSTCGLCKKMCSSESFGFVGLIFLI